MLPKTSVEKAGSATSSGIDRAAKAEIILSFEENSGRGRWEVGYMLYNLLLQATSLDVEYGSRLLNEQERAAIASVGISGTPAALFSLA